MQKDKKNWINSGILTKKSLYSFQHFSGLRLSSGQTPFMLINVKQLSLDLILSLLIVFLFFNQGCKEKQTMDTGYLVEGRISGADNKMIYLTDKAFYNDTHVKDSVLADSSGFFLFKGTIPEPSFYMLTVQDLNAPVDFILENSNIAIKGSVDSLWTATVTGSTEDSIHKEFIPFTDYYANQDRYNSIEAEYDSASKTGDRTALTRMLQQKRELSQHFQQSVERFMKKYPLSITAVNSLVYFIEDDLPKADSLLKGFESGSAGSHKQVVYFRKLINTKKGLLTGNIAPDFSQADTSGKLVRLSDFRSSYVLVDFWASWCVPCRQESPTLVKIYNKYKEKGLTILSVSLDDKKASWLKAIKKDKLEQWPHLSDLKGWQNEVAVQYGVDAVPSSMLLDPSGKIVAKNLRGEALERKMQELFE